MIAEFNVCLATDSATPWQDIVKAYRYIDERFASNFTMSSREAGSLPTAVVYEEVETLEQAGEQAEALGIRFRQNYVAIYLPELKTGYRVDVNMGLITIEGFDLLKFVRYHAAGVA